MSTFNQNILKRAGTLACFAFLIVAGAIAQGRNPVIEFCTGTWCQWCPCGDEIIYNTIVPNIPNAIVLAYHGPPNSSDPWSNFSNNGILSSLGFSGYPTGIIDRTSAPLSRSVWYSTMSTRLNVPPTVRINIEKTYDPGTRLLDATFTIDATDSLTGQFRFSLVFTEDSLTYPQTGNSSCTGGTNYLHLDIVRGLVNGELGEIVNAASPWYPGQPVVKSIQYTIPQSWNADNCKLVALVFKEELTPNTGEIQQAESWPVVGTIVSVRNDLLLPATSELLQNYPNPFNPVTKFEFRVSQTGWVTLKIFDALGREVAFLVNEEKSPGTYPAVWEATTFPSGLYFARLQVGTTIQTKKVILLR